MVPRVTINRFLYLFAFFIGCARVTGPSALAQALEAESPEPVPFIVKPYLQLGDAAKLAQAESLELLWHAEDADADWSVQSKPIDGVAWTDAEAPTWRRVAVESIAPHRVYRASLTGLRPGGLFEYRVSRNGELVFTAQGLARKPAGRPFQCVVMADCGVNSPEQREVAHQIHQWKPDFVVIPGDIVYNDGRISEYREKYFPIYNADQASPEIGAPLIRSTLFLGGLGAHDNGQPLSTHPDGFAYYMYWSQPLNGPPVQVGGPNTFLLGGTADREQAVLTAAGDRYPRMANYSFDYADSHWTMLDSQNPHADWNDPMLRDWLRQDLEAAKDATWKFVACYLPPFNSSTMFPHTQKTRIVADLFEEGGVDVVFCGYTHAYQRTYPLKFTADPRPTGPVKVQGHEIPGSFALDHKFDGRTDTTPEGVIYYVTGGGGNQQLHSPEQTDNPETWQPYTAKYIADVHQFTFVEVDGDRLTIRQVRKDGEELDRIVITKPGRTAP